MESKRYTIGKVKILIKSTNFNLECLNKELVEYTSRFEDKDTDIIINLVKDLPRLGPISNNGPNLVIGKDYYYENRYPFSSLVRKKKKRYEIFLSKQDPLILKERLHKILIRNRWISPSFIKENEYLASTIIYNFIYPFLELKLLEKRGTFIHASSVSYGDKAILFSGKGLVGKTYLSSELILKKKFKFLSDDLAIIRDKKVYPNLIPLFVYPYNKNLLSKSNLSKSKKVKWAILKIFKLPTLRLRISPIKVYGGENISYTPKKINSVFFIEKESFKIPPAINPKRDLQKIKNRIRTIILEEFSPLVKTMNYVNSVSLGIFPSSKVFLKSIDSAIDYNLSGKSIKSFYPPRDKKDYGGYLYSLYSNAL
jgi:hypothetical protein